MSGSIVAKIGALARETAAEAAWAQWSALTSAAVDLQARRPWATVDPEALVLASLAVREHERRLTDIVFGMARSGTRLLSVQRMSTLVETYSTAAQDGFREFAWAAAEAGDPRWAPHAETPAADGQPVRSKRLGALRLMDGPGLMLRLRTGLGVGTKADVLAFLLGVHGEPVPLKGMALATGYTIRGIRKAAEELAAGGFVQQTDGSPIAFSADHRAWAAVLGLNESRPGGRAGVPPWRYWSLVFGFLVAVDEWEACARAEGWSDYVASSRVRDLVQDHAPRVKLARIDLPDPRQATGAAYLEDLARVMARLPAWCRKNL
jgi:hypothetical protein